MMTLLFCLLTPGPSPDEVLDRYVALRRQAPAVEMAFVTGPLTATLTLVPDKRMRLEAKGQGVDYVCVINEEGMRDLDRVDHEYDETPDVRRPTRPPSRISGANMAFPNWILAKDFRALLPQARFISLGRRQVGGVQGDALQAVTRNELEGSTETLEVVIDERGIPRHVMLMSQAPMGTTRSEYTVRRYEPIAEPNAARFSVAVPDGYSPYSLNLVHGPAGVGETLPTTGWQAADGRPLDLRQRLPKGGIVAIWGADSEPSRRSAASLARLRTAGVPVVVLADAKVDGADGYDPDGRIFERLGVPATPVFYRVDAEGKIAAAWMGYDAAKASAFEREASGR